MMIVVYVVEIIHRVLIVQVHQMVMQQKIVLAYVVVMQLLVDVIMHVDQQQ